MRTKAEKEHLVRALKHERSTLPASRTCSGTLNSPKAYPQDGACSHTFLAALASTFPNPQTMKKFLNKYIYRPGVVILLLATCGAIIWLLGVLTRAVVWLFSSGYSVLFTLTVVMLISSCSLTTPIAATSNPLGTRVGQSKATVIFGLCIDGDASVETAAMNGGITRISTVDFRTQNFLWLVRVHTCQVRGE